MAVAVVGAGVMGLSVAVLLAVRGLDLEVRCDLDVPQTASATASAMIGPVMAPTRVPCGRASRSSTWCPTCGISLRD